jgi:hypothetical protein
VSGRVLATRVDRSGHDARDEAPSAWQATSTAPTVLVRRDRDARRLRGDSQGRVTRRSPRGCGPIRGLELHPVAWRPGAAVAAMFHEAHAPPA